MDCSYTAWLGVRGAVFKDSDSGGKETYWVKVLGEVASSQRYGGAARGDNHGNLASLGFSGWNV